MSGEVINYYKKISALGDKHYNPNVASGALVHPFRLIVSCPSGNSGSAPGKSNFVLNVVDKCACFKKIILVAASGRSEPLYIFLKKKLGKKLKILDDIDDLPTLPKTINTDPKRKKKALKKRQKKMESDEENDEKASKSDSDSGSGSEPEGEASEKSESEDESDDESPEETKIEKCSGKNQKLIIFDDMLFEGKHVEKIIDKWFARCRHLNYSIILTAQSWFRIPRPTRLNANYAAFLRLNSLGEIKRVIGDLALSMKPEQFMRAYEYCTKKPGDVMLIDMSDPDPSHRIRHNWTECVTVD